MENRNTILGINRRKVNIVHRIMLIAILHSSLIAPSQNMLIDYFNYREPLNYSGTTSKEEGESTPTNLPLSESILKKGENNSKIDNNNGKDLSYTLSPDIQNGVIGVSDTNPLDDASDNLFKFYIKDLPKENTKIFLTYELFGVQDCNGVSRSINDRPSTGGYLVKTQMGWTSQREEINLKWLKTGENKVMFGIPKDANYQYQIKNIKLEFDKEHTNTIVSDMVVNRPTVNYVKDNQLYVKGFLRNYNSDAKVYIEDTPLSFIDGEYEGFLKLTEAIKSRNFVMIKAFDGKGLLGKELVSLDNLAEADQLFVPEKNFDRVVTLAKANTNVALKADGASIAIKENILIEDQEISIAKLRNIDIAPMASGMINVTKGGYAYRFLPDGTKFDKPVELTIAYDEKLIPKGHNANEIKTFYFDTQRKSWVAIKRDTINKVDKSIVSLTNHFTDYINGIIQTPESPETAGFTPTMMNDIKAVDPSSEMTLISPPEVSQKGDANISYPIKIPAGRKGMQPQLAVQYSNEGGNGWLGQGWGINIPSIAIDTRWGIPQFDPINESEIYTIGGEQLMYPKIASPFSGQPASDWMPNRHYDVSSTNPSTTVRPRITSAVFTPRKQGSFVKIERLGATTKDYYWKVTTTDGTINWYGGKTAIEPNAVIKNSIGDIVHWGLYLTEDVFGNTIKYEYDKTALSGQTGHNENLNDGTYFHIKSIKYNGYNDADYKYEVNFNSSNIIRDDVSINERLGVKQIEPYFLDNIIVNKIGVTLPIRKYTLKTGYGLFKKGRLESITELDKDGNEFYKHTFDYYDDVTNPDKTKSYFATGVTQTICNEVASCLDTDGDGVCDAVDNCPTIAGPASNNGCPIPCLDTDGDGVCDADDNCPSVAGPASNNGCPIPCLDTDGDGVCDAIDNCPTVAGPASNYGCPTGGGGGGCRYATISPKKGVPFTIKVSTTSGTYDFQDTYIFPASMEKFQADFNKKLGISFQIEPNTSKLLNSDRNSTKINFESDIVINSITFIALEDKISGTISKVVKNGSQNQTAKVYNCPPLTPDPSLQKTKGSQNIQKNQIQSSNPFKDYLTNVSLNNTFSLTNGIALNSTCPKTMTNTTFLIPAYIPSFDSAPSLLGSSKTEAISAGFYVGIGIGSNPFTKMTTFGMQFNFGNDISEALTALIDINGDGLDDIVTKEGDFLYYKKHIVTRTYNATNEPIITHSFEDKKPITGIDNFYRAFGRNSSKNFQITYGLKRIGGFIGWDKSKSTSETRTYFTDANGDGLMDIVCDGVVYFNRLDANKNPNFIPDSQGTENLVITAAAKTVVTPAIPAEEEITIPAFDVVKVWEAPADGTIKIDNNIVLTDPTKEAVATVEFKREKESIEIPCGETVTDSKFVGNYTYSVDFGTTIGWVGLTYDAYGVPDKFDIVWNGTTFSSGFVGSSDFNQSLLNIGINSSDIKTATPSNGNGVLRFYKANAFPTKAEINVTAPLGGTAWTFTSFCTNNPPPTLKLSANTKNLKVVSKETKKNFSLSFPLPKKEINGTTTGIVTTIYINNNSINKDNHSYTLYSNTNELDNYGITRFISDIEKTYPNSKVRINNDIITIAITDSYLHFTTIDLKPNNEEAPLSYSFKEESATNVSSLAVGKTTNSSATNKIVITPPTTPPTTCNETASDLCLLYGTQLNSGNSSVTNTLTNNCSGLPLTVKKGDRIYFRVHSVAKGNPAVNWNPKVEYTTTGLAAITDANGQTPFSSSYSDGFVLSGKAPVKFPGNSGSAIVSWTPFNIMPTDVVTYQIIQETVSSPVSDTDNPPTVVSSSIIYSQLCNPNVISTVSPTTALNNIAVSASADNLSQTNFYFKVISASNVDWKNSVWKPKMEFKTDTNIIPDRDNPTISEGTVVSKSTVYPVADYDIYRLFPCSSNSFVKKDISTINGAVGLSIQPNLVGVFAAGDTGKINFVVKRGTTFVGTRLLTITNGVVTSNNTAAIPLGSSTASTIEIMYSIDDSNSNGSSASLLNKLALTGNTLATISYGSTNIPVSKTEINLYQKTTPKMGSFYRQWGQFMYNPANVTGATATGIANTNLIKEDALQLTLNQTQATELNTDLTAISTMDENTVTEAFAQNFQNTHQDYLNSSAFSIANPSRETINGTVTDRWIGLHNENYASDLAYQAAKLEQSVITIEESFPVTEQPVLNTGAYAINKLSKGHSNNNFSAGINLTLGPDTGATASVGVNGSKSNGGANNTLSDYVDFNGDQYPDIVTINKIQYTNKTGGLQDEIINNGQDISTATSDSYGFGASGSFSQGNKAGGSKNGTGNEFHRFEGFRGNSGAGISGSFTKGNSVTQRVWTDINGDGLSDLLVTETNLVNGSPTEVTKVTLNAGTTTPNTTLTNWGTIPLFKSTSQGISGGLGVNKWNGSVEAGISLTTSWNSTTNTLVDINGDGLLDLLNTDSNLGVQLNLGNKFDNNEIWTMNYNFKRESASVATSLNLGVTFALVWPIWITSFKIPAININGTPLSTSTNKTKKSITDFDGDGFPDLVEEISPNNVIVYHSKIRRTDMLKSVTNPLGGKFTIDYKVQPKDYNNPNAKWAMSDLVIEDNYDKVNDGADVYKKHFVYENGKYDRREREFYGYKNVKVEDYTLVSGTPTLYRTSVSNYYNESYFLNGLLDDSYVIKGGDSSKRFSRTQNFYEIFKLNATNTGIDQTTSELPTYDVGGSEGRRTAAVLLTKTITELYELAASPQLTTEVRFKYDDKGRVIEFNNIGNTNDASDDYTSTIAYYDLTNLNIISIPKSILVKVGSTTVRERKTEVDTNNGNITKISANNSSVWADTTMGYDPYGNLTSIKYPAASATAPAMTYNYTYDPDYHKYVTGITDAFSYTSSAKYNSDFDKIEETTDLAGNIMKYEYDSFGRNTLILAPKEKALGALYTLQFEYYPYFTLLPSSASDVTITNFVPIAVTKHYDIQHPTNPIETYTFIDGLARPIQVKKDININNGTTAAPLFIEALSVSGKTYYDELGRAKQQFHPYWELKVDNKKFLLNEYVSTYNTLTEYDELDRPVKSTDPEGNISTMQYSLDTDVNGVKAIKTLSDVDQNGNQHIITETYKDVSGKVISTKNQGGTSGNIWTKFSYNAIGELQSYTDADNIATSYTYDMLGRKKTIQSPDSGLTSYTYDIAGNLTELQTANLAVQGKKIEYAYDKNRLTNIKYPDISTGVSNLANVDYTYGTTGNQTGRLIKQKDATGLQVFDYDNMGNIITNDRTIIGPNIPKRQFKTYFTYDSWNRLQTMTYPDGEIVTYSYDLGGNLNKMTGQSNGTPYNYINRIDYDYFEQKTYMKYGNNTETFYNYSPALRRLSNLNVKTAAAASLFNNTYQYDKVGNVLSINNTAGITVNYMGGNYNHNFQYDNLNRLASANGTFTGSPTQITTGNDANSSYSLAMVYNNTHGIVSKTQTHYKNTGYPFDENSYANDYKYLAGSHKVSTIKDANTFIDQTFGYDKNGNLISKINYNGIDETLSQTNYFWDESNRLRVLVDAQNTMHHYIYDASGERVLKASSDYTATYENGTLLTPGTVTFNSYTTYPSAFIVVNGDGVFSKHYYAGSQRIVSRLGNATATSFDCPTCATSKLANPNKTQAEETALQQAQIADLQRYMDKANKGKAGFKDYNPQLLEDQESAIAEEANAEKATTEIAMAVNPITYKKPPSPPSLSPIYYYHPDHLGTSTFLTDVNGVAYQFFLNLPYGETMAEQLGTSYYKTPYKFNGKELDADTGLYYYGARYYDPKTSIWLSVDPLAEDYPNVNPYNYCFSNPVNLIDPDGRGPGLNRFFGGLRAVGGVLQVAGGAVGGAATSWTGIGAVVGGIAVVHGADDFQTGVRQLWSGEETESFTYKGIKAGAKVAGASESTASKIATGADIGLSFVGGGAGGLKVLGKFSSAEASAYSKIGSTGKIGEDALKLLGGKPQVGIKTTLGWRYIDQLVNGIANESKVGRTSLTKDVITQIAKDVELIRTEKIEGSVWNFFRSPVTGQIGPTKPLLNALKEAGIKAVIHE